MGKTDKTIRLTVAVILAALYFTHTVTGNLGIFLLAFAAILVITSIINFCPLYSPWGINTNKKNKMV